VGGWGGVGGGGGGGVGVVGMCLGAYSKRRMWCYSCLDYREEGRVTEITLPSIGNHSCAFQKVILEMLSIESGRLAHSGEFWIRGLTRDS